MTELARRCEEAARQAYIDETSNHPTIHCNRFPSWSELSAALKAPYLERAAAALRAGGET